MLSLKYIVFFSLLNYLSYGSVLKGQTSSITDSEKMSSAAPTKGQCGPGKSHHSRNDLKVLIDHMYKNDGIEEEINKSYQPQVLAIREKHIESLKCFAVWFENQPEHLKHVIERISILRKEKVEPNIAKVLAVLEEYPHLEEIYNEKHDNTEQLINKLSKYMQICNLNCDNIKYKVENITKLNAIPDEYYCSSIKDLHDTIKMRLSEFVVRFKNESNKHLNIKDEKYETKIENIKGNLKDKALKVFGRNMYDILNLVDNYHHLMNDLNIETLDKAIYNIKNLGIQVDSKLLNLEQAIEKYGRYCRSCSNTVLNRNTREADVETKIVRDGNSPHLLDEVLQIKYSTVTTEAFNYSKDGFKVLDEYIENFVTKEFNFDNLKLVQKDIEKMTQDEKEELTTLKNAVPDQIIKKILQLIKKLKALLSLIESILEKLPPI